MAASPDATGLTCWRSVVLGLLLALAWLPLRAQTRISLAQLGLRKAPDYSSVHDGQMVIVRGVVSVPARHFAEYTTLSIQDSHHGGLLKVPLPDTWLDRYQPGEELEAAGTVIMQYGMTMLVPDKITVLGRTATPQPVNLSVRELQNHLHLGEVVTTQGPVIENPAYNSGGALILLSGQQEPYRLFIPRPPGAPKTNRSEEHTT